MSVEELKPNGYGEFSAQAEIARIREITDRLQAEDRAVFLQELDEGLEGIQRIPTESAESAELRRIRRAYSRYGAEPAELHRRDESNPGLRWLESEWHRRLAEGLESRGVVLGRARVLDLGCGAGRLLSWLVECGADARSCAGIDLMPERVEEAGRRVPGANIVCGNAAELPFADEAFDVVSMSMVISSILDRDLARALCAEASRVVAQDGVIVWYDTRFPNPRNRDVRRVGAREIRNLFPGFHVELDSITLLPPLARLLGRRAPRLYPVVVRIPALRARHLGFLMPKEART